jgi:hypothetical protein
MPLGSTTTHEKSNLQGNRKGITQNLAERLCWQATRRNDRRMARRLYRK